jgi:hypothetical protein
VRSCIDNWMRQFEHLERKRFCTSYESIEDVQKVFRRFRSEETRPEVAVSTGEGGSRGQETRGNPERDFDQAVLYLDDCL